MNEVPKQRWGCLQWGIIIFLLLVLANMFSFLGSGSRVQYQGNQMKAVNNCKQIILSLKQYAKDADSAYPDGRHPEHKSANQVFRVLFKDDIVVDERIFGCPTSAFNPDQEIGLPSDFDKALEAGECHWMILKHQTEEGHPKMPLIVENSLKASWPPKWDVSAPDGIRKRGQPWSGRLIVIGRSDGTVQVEKLRPDGTLDWHSEPNLDEHGKSWIDSLTREQIAKLAYWDIEEK